MPRHNLKWIIEIAIFAVSGTLAFLLRFDYVLEPPILRLLLYALPIWIAMKSVAFYALHIDRIWWTFVSIPDVFRIGVANCAGSLLSAVVIVPLLASRGFPRSVYVLDLIICVLLTAAALVAARARDAIFRAGAGGGSRTVLIHGAGRAGIMLLREIEGNPSLGMRVCGFTDDDPRKQGMFIEGQPVLGSACDIATLVAKLRIEQILVAIPSATGAEMTAILRQCHNAGVTCKTIPGLSNLVQGHGLVRQMRDVAVEDLLGRKPVQLDTEAISSKLGGKIVMVTGAAGSIGSELCRQVAGFCPDAVVAFDFSETALFFLNEEMRRNFPELPFHPEVGSIQSPQRLARPPGVPAPGPYLHLLPLPHHPRSQAGPNWPAWSESLRAGPRHPPSRRW
jgi:FlaA1/EpsC-like NDP-sugar epimerase